MSEHQLQGPRLIRVDSAQEQIAYLLSRYGDPATWSVVSQRIQQAPDGRDVEQVEIEFAGGGRAEVRFVTSDDDPFDPAEPEDTTVFLDAVIEAAAAFGAANPPQHPGTMARFPVPSERYERTLAVPMPVLAVSEDGRGLFAPPRYVALAFPSLEPVGVGEFPGFDPERWPPQRLGAWPPPQMAELHHLQIQGTIQRFSACWHRILNAWFDHSGTISADLTTDIAEALSYRALLDLETFFPYYDKLNPNFAAWVGRIVASSR
jgi:hypothetical protein